MPIDPAVDLTTALLVVTTGLLVAVAAWTAAIVVFASWHRTSRWALAMTPRILRAALLTGVSGAVALGPVRASADDLDGLPLPDRPVTSTIADQSTHVVSAGQTLWSIAAGESGSGASVATVARETTRWYLRNREVIGDDPDLIVPGQVLRAPTAQEPR